MFDVRIRKQVGTFPITADFSVHKPGVTALFGPSGAGKSSVIHMMAGLLRPDDGYIRVQDRDLFHKEKGIHLPPERRRIGCVFQDARLFPHMKVQTNLTYGMRLVPESQRFIDFSAVVDLLGIGHLLDRRPAKLSGGEKQRVAIGRALLTSPRLLLMDEPLAALDADRKRDLLPFIQDLSRKFQVPILYVSHAVDEIRCLADRMILMKEGKTRMTGDVDTVLAAAGIRADIRPFPCRKKPAKEAPAPQPPHLPDPESCKLRFWMKG